MLEFMVLGEIPGTGIQFNFTDVLLAAAWILVFLEAFIIIHRWRHNVALATTQRSANPKRPVAKSKSKAKKPAQKARKTTLKVAAGSA